MKFFFGTSTPAKVDFKYLDFGPIGGRGGVVRFFMLLHNIAYNETLITPGADWQVEKKRLVESGENPAGTVPVVHVDGRCLTQHVATMRELAKSFDISSGDFASDAVADEYQGFRDAWVEAAFMGGDKAKFTQLVADKLKVFEGLYNKYAADNTFLAVGRDSKALWGDVALFALLRDIVKTGFLDTADLPPRLAKAYAALAAEPSIASWIKEKEAAA